MKVNRWFLVILALLLADWRVVAQSLTDEAEQRARDLLRETVKQRETPKPAPIYTSNPAPPPAVPEGRELAPTGKAKRPLNYAELEQAYLSGKISARQFQKSLETGTQEPAPIITSQTPAKVVRQETPQPGTMTPTPKPAAAPKPEVKAEDASASPLNDVEKKMDELLRLKAARDQAAANAAAASTNSAPKTKRERMDALLKLYINGKVSEADYKAKRDKLITE